MLDVDAVDVAGITGALQDQSDTHSWWLDPRTGAVELWSELAGDEAGAGHPDDRGLLPIEPLPPSEAYADMEDFVAQVAVPEPRAELERAILGRGAFGRFKDTLLDYPDLREAWFGLLDARMYRRAVSWLADRGVIDPGAAEREVGAHPDPRLPAAALGADRHAMASSVAGDLRALYGSRLQRVLMFGSSARATAHEGSDLDLLVVLSEMPSSWEERRRMDAILWRHTLEHGVVVSAIPVRAADLDAPDRPFLVRATREGHDVG